MSGVVPAFLDAARAYRSALALEEPLDSAEFARRVRNAVARVYLAATRLPRGGATTTDTPEPRENRSARALEYRLASALGERSLAQELVEIDERLADSIARLEEPQSPDALWDAGFAFENHWGKHAVDVLRPLHHIARGGVV